MSLAAAVRERLEDELPEGTKLFEAARLPDDPGQRRAPALYVVPESASAAPNRLSNAVSQRITETIAVVIVEQSRNDPLGDKARQAVERQRKAIRGALLGYEPDGWAPLEYRRGALVAIDRERRVVWAESYASTTQWRMVPGQPEDC